jgi:hypothetical protein
VTGELDEAERFLRAAMLGSAMAAEIQRILRDNVRPAEVAADGTIAVQVPFPESAVLYAVLDAATACFADFTQAGDSAQEARQAVLAPVLQLAALAADAADMGWPQGSGVG